MTDEQLLLLCLIFLYVLECLCVLRRDEVALLAPLRGGWHIRRGIDAYGNELWAISINNPLPLWGYGVVCQNWPICASPEAMLAHSVQTPNPGPRPTQVDRLVRYGEISSVEPQPHSLHVNGELFVRTGSAAAARRLAGEVRNIAAAPPNRRGGLIDRMLAATLDRGAIEQALALTREATADLRFLCTALLLFLVVAGPLAIWQYGLDRMWPALLAGLILLNVATIVAYWCAHKKLYPQDAWERRSAALTMVLFPLATIRAHDRIWRQAMTAFHPLAVASVLCSREVFVDFAGRYVRDMAHPVEPVCPTDTPEARAVVEFFTPRAVAAIDRLLRLCDVDPADLLTRPAAEEDAKCYCPRCHTQYIVEKDRCEACGGVPARAFRDTPPLAPERLARASPAGQASRNEANV